MTKPSIAAFTVFLAACGGADNKAVDAPEPAAEPATPVAPAAVLTIAPFTLTTTSTAQDGTKKVRIIRGTADGVISGEKDGEVRELVRVTADGSFTPLVDGRTDVVKLDASGALTLEGKTFPGVRVGDDGTIYRDDKPVLKIEDGKVIDVTGEVLVSRVTMNGKVVSESKFEIAVEGGDEVRKLVATILLLQMVGGKAEPAPAAVERQAAPAPVPESIGTP